MTGCFGQIFFQQILWPIYWKPMWQNHRLFIWPKSRTVDCVQEKYAATVPWPVMGGPLLCPIEKDKTQAAETKMSSTHCISENSTQRACMYKTCTYLSTLMALLSDAYTGPPPFLGHRFDVFQKEFQILICLTTEYFQWALTHIFISTTDKTLYPM